MSSFIDFTEMRPDIDVLRARGTDWYSTAEVLGVSDLTLRNYRRRVGDPWPPLHVALPWTADELAVLRSGLSLREMTALLPGRTYRAVVGKVWREGRL